jgi:diguanylate cyclase (GGDEF)-like protein
MKILVLNNDLMERSVIQQVLQANKYEVIAVGNSAGAIQLLREGDIQFVIADRATTDIDEKQFIQHLREEQPPYYVYVVVITAKVQDIDLVNSRIGADDYLHKPVAPVELKSRVQIGQRMLELGSELAHARTALDQTAIFDPLTHTLNQTAFLNLAPGEVERARRFQAPLSLIALQINNFADIEAQHGEAIAGDVLTLISQGLHEKSRPYDGIGHYERNVFLIPLPGVIGQDAEKIATRMLKGILNSEIALLDGTTLTFNLSIVVVSATHVTISTEMQSLIKKAKELLARAQNNGSNQVETVFI